MQKEKNYLRFTAAEFNLSQAEVSFIADNRIREHAGSSYLSISAKELSEKHFRYLNHVQSLAQQEQFEIGSVLDSTSAEKVMGSNRSMPNKEIIIRIIFIYTTGKSAIDFYIVWPQ